jgi:hypothetical protein
MLRALAAGRRVKEKRERYGESVVDAEAIIKRFES